MTPTALVQPAARTSSDVAAASSAFEEWLVGDLAARNDSRVLVVSPFHFDPRRFTGKPKVTMLCGAERGGADPGFTAESFETVYLHRAIDIAAPGRWLDRARRVLKPEGRLVAVFDPAEFSFAPLPVGGDACLLGRILAQAGFSRVEAVHRTPCLIIASAYRSERDRSL